MSNPQQTSNTAPNTNDLFWTHELDPRLRPHHLHSRDRHPSSGSSTDGASFHVPFIVACPDHFGSFGSSSSSADAFHDSTATTADTSSGTCIKSKSSKLIKIHTESDEDDLVEATSESSPKATFRMMADEIINCANPNESHTIDPSEYAPLGGRQFVTRSSFLVVIGYFGLIVGSAYMFTLVEQVNEDSFSLFRLQSEFIRMYPHVDDSTLLLFIRTAIDAQKRGVDVEHEFQLNSNRIRAQIEYQTNRSRSRNPGNLWRPKRQNDRAGSQVVTNHPQVNSILVRKTYQWDLKASLLFVISVATTIGYGNIVPETVLGKWLTLLFGFVAIPSTTLLTSVLVAKFCNGPLRRFKLNLLTQHFALKDNRTLRLIRMICLVLISLFVLIALLLLPACLFTQLQPDWTLLDAFYFCFISITTTGLGDLVPEYSKTSFHWLYEVLTIVYLYVGIFFIMLWMTQIKSCFRKSLTLKLDEIEEDETVNEGVLEEQCLLYYYHQKNYINYGSFYGYDDITVKIPQRVHSA